MITATQQHIQPGLVRAALSRFWSEQLVTEPSRGGVTVALPLMYPDGLQVVVHIQPLTRDRALITDQGKTLMTLDRDGINLDRRAKQNYELLEERKKVFELQQDGYELSKVIKLPLEGLDVHVFAESLVSIAHMIYRMEPRVSNENMVHQSMRRLFSARSLHVREDGVLAGRVEKQMRFDFVVEENRKMAVKTVDIRDRVRDYMERWAWRMTDLRNGTPEIVRAMIYNPDEQGWDDTSLAIGREVCNLFCPYYETDRISEALERLKAA